MVGTETRKTLRKLVMVVLLMAGLIIQSTVGVQQEAQAATCCTACDPNYNDCVYECDTDPWQSACYNTCTFMYNRCVQNCDPGC